jgi:transcriptional antiterminator RfaH
MPYWAVAQVHPQRDQLALCCLRQGGFKTYQPLLREQRWVRGRRVERSPALFPGYLFFWIELQWHSARWAWGVTKLVMDGDHPAQVPDQVISEIRARERGGRVELPPRLQAGDRVRITAGPFIDHLGLFEGMAGSERVAVLLRLFNSSRRLKLPSRDVEPA